MYYANPGPCTVAGTSTYEGRTLHCIELPNGELVDVLEVEGGLTTQKYTDENSCPAGYDIWVPRSYDHAKAVVDAVDPKFTELVGVYRTQDDQSTTGQTEASCGGCTSVAMNSEAYGVWESQDSNRVPWTSVAGKPWFMRSSTHNGPRGLLALNADAGAWI